MTPLTFPSISADAVADTHVVYSINAGPHLLYINSCALTDLFDLRDLRNNSDWQTIATGNPAQPIEIFILSIGPALEMRNTAFRAVQEHQPRCNVYGYDVSRRQRRILCSNGMTYNTQMEAAAATGVAQSQLSRHLNGDGGPCKGLTFSWDRPA